MAAEQDASRSPSRRATARRRARQGRAGPRRWLGWALVLLVLLTAGAVLVNRVGLVDRQLLPRIALPGRTAPAGQDATLYFADPRWTQLVPEVRRMPAGLDGVQALRSLVDALSEGPREEGGAPVLPRGLQVQGAYLGADGLAVIDFEPGLAAYPVGGASGEVLTVYALVHTLCENVPGVRSVQILVGGEERETLAGHVKISEPLAPDPQWTRERP